MTLDNSDLQSRKERVLKQIDSAFDGVELEDGVTLLQAVVIDDWGSEEEEARAQSQGHEKRWQDVPDQSIIGCCSALSYMDDKGFRFYLPAFMSTALRYFPNDPNDIRYSCEHYLTYDFKPPSERKSDPEWITTTHSFTTARVAAIASFLRVILNFDPEFEPEFERGKSLIAGVDRWEQFAAKVNTGNSE